MHLCNHVEWVRHYEGKLEDTGQLSRIIEQLPRPAEQYPRFIHLIGTRAKDDALRELFPSSRRRRRTGAINLRLQTSSMGSDHPVCFADSNPFSKRKAAEDLRLCHDESSHVTAWSTGDHTSFDVLHSRLLFLFSDVVCVFADDYSGLPALAEQVRTWVKIGNASTLPLQVRPRLIVVTSNRGTFHDLETEDFRAEIHTMVGGIIERNFQSVKLFRLADDHLSSAVRHLRLKDEMLVKAEEMKGVRQHHRCLFSALHLEAFFRQAVQHTASTITESFDFVAAGQLSNMRDSYAYYLQTFLEVVEQIKPAYDVISSSIASSILADAYPPRSHCMKHYILLLLVGC